MRRIRKWYIWSICTDRGTDNHRGMAGNGKEKRKECIAEKARGGCGLQAILVVLGAAFFIWNLCAGSVPVPAGEVLSILTGEAEDATAASIVLKIRLPRACAAFLLGGALGLSGYLLQTFFHNPIAGPFVLGISSGAKLCVALVLIALAGGGARIGTVSLIAAAYVGALLSMGFVLLLSVKMHRMSMLIVAGIMIGYICSAVTDFVVTFADDADIVNLHNWSRGSFSGMNMNDVVTMAVLILLCFLGVLLLAKPIAAYQAGEEYALTLGVNVQRLKILLILLSSLLAACVTAYAGPVSFVGIAVPQLMRGAAKRERPLLLIPACFLGGGVFCLISDLIARSVFAPTELSISTVTAVFGAPVVIAVLLKRQREA